jgi:Porin subfamily
MILPENRLPLFRDHALKGGMRNILLAIAIAALPAFGAAAEQPAIPKPDTSANSGKLLPVKKNTGAVSSCAAYGAGFVKLEGSDTCVRIGGAVRLDGAGQR